jgi:type I restriction enzyme S subunit
MPLAEVAPAKARKGALPPGKKVWHLTLDQILSGADSIINPVYADVSEASPSTCVFGPEHVLYSKLRPYLNKVICPNEIGIATTELVPLRPDPELLDRRFLCYYLRSPEFVSWASKSVAGAKMPRLKMKAFWQYEIPVPPLAQQKKVVSVLDKSSSIKSRFDEAIDELNSIVPAIFYDMFGSLGKKSKGWPTDEIGIYCKNVKKEDPAKKTNKEFVYIDIASINNKEGRIETPKQLLSEDAPSRARQKVATGDVIVATVRPNLRGTAWVPSEYDGQICSTGFSVLRPDPSRLTTEYLYSITRDMWFTGKLVSMTTGANYPAVRHKDVLGIKIPIPPIELQHEFALKVQVIRGLQDKYRKAAAESEDLFNSLVQRAFKGEL